MDSKDVFKLIELLKYNNFIDNNFIKNFIKSYESNEINNNLLLSNNLTEDLDFTKNNFLGVKHYSINYIIKNKNLFNYNKQIYSFLTLLEKKIIDSKIEIKDDYFYLLNSNLSYEKIDINLINKVRKYNKKTKFTKEEYKIANTFVKNFNIKKVNGYFTDVIFYNYDKPISFSFILENIDKIVCENLRLFQNISLLNEIDLTTLFKEKEKIKNIDIFSNIKSSDFINKLEYSISCLSNFCKNTNELSEYLTIIDSFKLNKKNIFEYVFENNTLIKNLSIKNDIEKNIIEILGKELKNNKKFKKYYLENGFYELYDIKKHKSLKMQSLIESNTLKYNLKEKKSNNNEKKLNKI